ncbi:conserved hypothetical protein [Cupriavidus taiwanensis]|uniref:TIGR02679 family protein n=1 Tax=Cupriavidus taiwanensis TaxID=164546 RepID=UPI000E139F00|nr:TIGR02679 family protein [Cupriavidus taiwanensis]SPA23344.1 conserved hypothetical protein [Cupriavidus taiwanensis]
MTDAPSPRLHNLLGGDDRASLRARLRRVFERERPEAPIAGVVNLRGLPPAHMETLRLILGRPYRHADSISFCLEDVDWALHRAGLAPSLRIALEMLDGPIVNKEKARTDERLAWEGVADSCQDPPLQRFLESSLGRGLIKRLSTRSPERARILCRHAAEVLQRLPLKGVPLAQLAAETHGDAHALDRNRPIASLVLAVLRQSSTTPDDENDDTTRTADEVAEERARDTWARAGVLVNELARPALCLNLPMRPSDRSRFMRGEPGYLTLRQLVRNPETWEVAGIAVFVCENPEVVTIAANALGASCAPLVCTDGMPAAAQRHLLTSLKRSGADLHYHGDYDWEGIRIGNHVMRAYGTNAWRFGAAEYERVVAATRDKDFPATGEPVLATWEPELTTMMKLRSQFRAEERVVEDLLGDLAAGFRT